LPDASADPVLLPIRRFCLSVPAPEVSVPGPSATAAIITAGYAPEFTVAAGSADGRQTFPLDLSAPLLLNRR